MIEIETTDTKLKKRYHKNPKQEIFLKFLDENGFKRRWVPDWNKKGEEYYIYDLSNLSLGDVSLNISGVITNSAVIQSGHDAMYITQHNHKAVNIHQGGHKAVNIYQHNHKAVDIYQGDHECENSIHQSGTKCKGEWIDGRLEHRKTPHKIELVLCEDCMHKKSINENDIDLKNWYDFPNSSCKCCEHVKKEVDERFEKDELVDGCNHWSDPWKKIPSGIEIVFKYQLKTQEKFLNIVKEIKEKISINNDLVLIDLKSPGCKEFIIYDISKGKILLRIYHSMNWGFKIFDNTYHFVYKFIGALNRKLKEIIGPYYIPLEMKENEII